MRHAGAGGMPARAVAACRLAWAGLTLFAWALSACALSAWALPAWAGPADRALRARGEYLVRIMDCTGCHTYGALAGAPDMSRFLGGADTGFQIPGLGVFYPPNLTPDPATGLGRWRRADIVRAIRTGKLPDGRALAPAMPWRSYANLTAHDALAVATYLKSLKPVRYQVPGPFEASQPPTQPYLTRLVPPLAPRGAPGGAPGGTPGGTPAGTPGTLPPVGPAR